MKVLLDTHAFLWFIHGNKNLSEIAINCFLEPENQLFLSTADKNIARYDIEVIW